MRRLLIVACVLSLAVSAGADEKKVKLDLFWVRNPLPPAYIDGSRVVPVTDGSYAWTTRNLADSPQYSVRDSRAAWKNTGAWLPDVGLNVRVNTGGRWGLVLGYTGSNSLELRQETSINAFRTDVASGISSGTFVRDGRSQEVSVRTVTFGAERGFVRSRWLDASLTGGADLSLYRTAVAESVLYNECDVCTDERSASGRYINRRETISESSHTAARLRPYVGLAAEVYATRRFGLGSQLRWYPYSGGDVSRTQQTLQSSFQTSLRPQRWAFTVNATVGVGRRPYRP